MYYIINYTVARFVAGSVLCCFGKGLGSVSCYYDIFMFFGPVYVEFDFELYKGILLNANTISYHILIVYFTAFQC